MPRRNPPASRILHPIRRHLPPGIVPPPRPSHDADVNRQPPVSPRLVVFARAPRPGTVKSRLAIALGDAWACAAYTTLARHVLGRLAEIRPGELRHTPDDAGPELAGWLPRGWQPAPQGSGDLGARMARTFAEHFQLGAARVVIVGSDCPDMTPADIRDAGRALAEHDLVLGPAADGGYWLIGLRTGATGWETLLREMPWGTDCVLAETRRRAAAGGLRAASLRTLRDVDEPADWYAWRERTREIAEAAGGSAATPVQAPPGPAR